MRSRSHGSRKEEDDAEDDVDVDEEAEDEEEDVTADRRARGVESPGDTIKAVTCLSPFRGIPLESLLPYAVAALGSGSESECLSALSIC